MPDEPSSTLERHCAALAKALEPAYKPVPSGYRGWRCGTDATGECLCGEDGRDPSMIACPHGILVPETDKTTEVTDKSTVRVRILVAVDQSGEWRASGSSSISDVAIKEWLYIDDLEDGAIYHWIEADVPLPREAGPAIEGTIKNA